MGVVRRTVSPYAAPLRRDMTDAERALWHESRNRRLGGHKFKRQWTIGSYIADFCCIESRLIVEVDGGQHDEDRDRVRTRELRTRGYRILRFWNHDVLGKMDGVLQTFAATLLEAKKEEDPHPSPLPQAGEGA